MPKQPRLKFVAARLRGIKPPAKDRATYYDTEVRSLTLQVTAAGSKTFYHYAWHDNKPVRTRLGRLDELTVADARAAAKTIARPASTRRQPTRRAA